MKTNARQTYKTMRGKTVDMDLLQQRNELTPAVGNARVNARGDELGPGGKIIRKKEDILSDYYENSDRLPDVPMPSKATDSAVKADLESSKAAPKGKSRAQQKVEAKGIEEDPKMAAEFGDDDEWVEDDNGNFVPKSEA
jgi:hypothetical protein